MSLTFEVAHCPSPIGPLVLAAGPRGLVYLDLHGDRAGLEHVLRTRLGAERLVEQADPVGAVSTLERYFAGDLRALDALPVDPRGTPFQCEVWLTLRRIAAGTTWSYAELAQAVGRPRAVRAVGAANGANPVALVLPCHRVIGSDRRLVGYGGGLDRKRWLLGHEGASFRAAESAPAQRALWPQGDDSHA
jgi:methylated-DNA-[protein]-cysteine S-methyltransferase